MKKRPRVGLAIGEGAAYGLAAIGILKVLEENYIPIDVISGTSMGSVIGALYASGMKSFKLEDELFGIEWKELLDFIPPQKGLISGKKIEKHMRELLQNKTFEELKIPLYITAVDLKQGQQIVFNKGDVASAVRASISIPGIFTPVEMEGMTLVDGGVLDPVPTDVLKGRSEMIIAIDFEKEIKSSYASAKKEKSEFMEVLQNEFLENEIKYVQDYFRQGKVRIPIPFRWFLSPNYVYKIIKKQSLPISSLQILDVTKKSYHLMASEMAKLKLQNNKPDILITPDLGKMHWLEFDKGSYAMKQGELAAKEKVEEIKKILKKR